MASDRIPDRAVDGVLLLNLGGPEKLEDVRPFLYNLFSDPDIIRIENDTLRKLLAWSIATLRQGKSRGLYRQIGGGSPLRRITDGQAAALKASLGPKGCRAAVYVGMRCWNPTIDDAVAAIRRDGVERLVILPLFPQYSVTTTGSCFNYLRALASRTGLAERTQLIYVEDWFEVPLYIESMVELIRQAQGRFTDGDPRKIRLLYSAHSIPARYVAEGDPYLEQTQATVGLIDTRLGNEFTSTLSFQSKVGPVKWLGPPTDEVIVAMGKQGVEKLLVVPVSFVSDHIETLQEIDILYRRQALDSGIREFQRAASLNLYPKFIEGLAEVVLSRLRAVS
jgi:ferrochelatase